MELVVAFGVLVALGLLAMRFGVDSRTGLTTPERPLSDSDWGRGATGPAEPVVRVLTAPPTDASFPTLRAIDAARGADVSPLASDPNAAHLERRARELTDAYWSEYVWLTGLVPHLLFEKVVAALEKERSVPTERNVTVLVMRQTASARTAIAAS